MYVRFRFVQQQTINKNFDYSKIVIITNWASLGLGVIYCFGLSLVANFQITAVPAIHLAGVVLASGFAGFYQMSQVKITFKFFSHKFNTNLRIRFIDSDNVFD